MRIMTSGGWVSAMLDGLTVGLEANLGCASVEMTLLFPDKRAFTLASLAAPMWGIGFDPNDPNDSERSLMGFFSKDAPESVEERVAEAIMGDLPAGTVQVDEITTLEGQEVGAVASVGGAPRYFFGMKGYKRVKVRGRTVSRAESDGN